MPPDGFRRFQRHVCPHLQGPYQVVGDRGVCAGPSPSQEGQGRLYGMHSPRGPFRCPRRARAAVCGPAATEHPGLVGGEAAPACSRTLGREECMFGTRLVMPEPKERPQERAGLSFCSGERDITSQKSVPSFNSVPPWVNRIHSSHTPSASHL